MCQDFRTCLVLAAATLAIASVATTVGTALPKVLGSQGILVTVSI